MKPDECLKLKNALADQLAEVARQALANWPLTAEEKSHALFLAMLHGILAKEWEQRFSYDVIEEIRDAIKRRWAFFHAEGGISIVENDVLRAAICDSLQEIIDDIDELSVV